MAGAISSIMKYANRENKLDLRLEVAYFARSLCTRKFTSQMFICCKGLPILIDFLDEDYSGKTELILIAIDCILDLSKFQVIILTQAISKNDFCHILGRNGFLQKLAYTLRSSNFDICSLRESNLIKISSIFLTFSFGDIEIQEIIADPSCLNGSVFLIVQC